MRMINKTRQFAAAVGAIVIALGVATVGASSANAATKVNIGAGASFGQGTVFMNGSTAAADFCTIAGVGRDAAGKLLALTAGHCSKENVAPFTDIPGLWIKGVRVGTAVGREYTGPPAPQPTIFPGYYDFAFYAIDESKVTMGSERGANVSAGLAAPGFHPGTFTQVCISGLTSGKRCGSYIGNGGTNPRTNIIGIAVQPGDSGGPLYTADGKLLGTGGAGGIFGVSYYPDALDAVNYARSKGWISGFRVIA